MLVVKLHPVSSVAVLTGAGYIYNYINSIRMVADAQYDLEAF